jgi:hypothetical protein
MKSLLLVALILIAVVGVVLFAYYRPTVEVIWFGRTVTLF